MLPQLRTECLSIDNPNLIKRFDYWIETLSAWGVMSDNAKVPVPRFTGIFLPVEILDLEDLTLLEKIMLSWIDALFDSERGGCWASNTYLSKRLQAKENTIAKSITKLRSLGLIEDISFDGRERVIRATIGRHIDKCQSKAALEVNPKQPWIKIQCSVGEKSNASTPASYIESKEERKEEKVNQKDPDAGASSRPVGLTSASKLLKVEKEKKEASHEGRILAQSLWDRIKGLLPDHRATNLDKWAQDMDRILLIDSRPFNEVLQVLTWVFEQSTFWPKNILSPDKLRKQYDRLRIDMKPIENKGSWITKNRAFAYEVQSDIKRVWQYKQYSVDGSKGVTRIDTKQFISFELEPKIFDDTLLRAFNLQDEYE